MWRNSYWLLEAQFTFRLQPRKWFSYTSPNYNNFNALTRATAEHHSANNMDIIESQKVKIYAKRFWSVQFYWFEGIKFRGWYEKKKALWWILYLLPAFFAYIMAFKFVYNMLNLIYIKMFIYKIWFITDITSSCINLPGCCSVFAERAHKPSVFSRLLSLSLSPTNADITTALCHA